VVNLGSNLLGLSYVVVVAAAAAAVGSDPIRLSIALSTATTIQLLKRVQIAEPRIGMTQIQYTLLDQTTLRLAPGTCELFITDLQVESEFRGTRYNVKTLNLDT